MVISFYCRFTRFHNQLIYNYAVSEVSRSSDAIYEVIDEILPVVERMKNVCELYAKNDFFDF